VCRYVVLNPVRPRWGQVYFVDMIIIIAV
jgi:hypothetical protein